MGYPHLFLSQHPIGVVWLCLFWIVVQCLGIGDLHLVAFAGFVGHCAATHPWVGFAQLQECELVFLGNVGPTVYRLADGYMLFYFKRWV